MTEENRTKKPRRKIDVRFYTIFWWLVLTLSVLALVLMAVSGLVVDQTNTSSVAEFLRSMVSGSGLSLVVQEIGGLVSNGVVSGVLFGLMSAAITLSLIYIYKIPSIRRIAIQILAAGYYENFLHRVIQKVYSQTGSTKNSVIIILPGFALVENKSIYWNSFQSFAEKHGFRFVQETTDADFGRNVFTIQKNDKSPIPIFIDMPTTLTNLKKIIELEEHSPVGTTSSRKRIKERFYFLRDAFEEELRTYVREHDWGNVRIVEGRSLRGFEQEIGEIMEEIANRPGD